MKLFDNEAVGEAGVHLLLPQRRGRCPAGGLPAGHSPLCIQLQRGVPAHGHGPLRPVLRLRSDAQPCSDCNRYMKFERMLRRARNWASGTPPPATMPAGPGMGRWLLKKGLDRKGSELLPLPPGPAVAGAFSAPTGGSPKPRCRNRRGAGLCQRPQAGQSGHLLCAGRGLRRLPRPLHRSEKQEPGQM